MRFNVTRLCGGKALMVAPASEMEIDLASVPEKLGKDFAVKSSDDMMLVLLWKDMEVTIYSSGKMMFYPLSEKDVALKYASSIIAEISSH